MALLLGCISLGIPVEISTLTRALIVVSGRDCAVLESRNTYDGKHVKLVT